jgi:hypothetical protein
LRTERRDLHLLLHLLFFLSFPLESASVFTIAVAVALALAFLSVIPSENLLVFLPLLPGTPRLQPRVS